MYFLFLLLLTYIIHMQEIFYVSQFFTVEMFVMLGESKGETVFRRETPSQCGKADSLRLYEYLPTPIFVHMCTNTTACYKIKSTASQLTWKYELLMMKIGYMWGKLCTWWGHT